MRWCRSSSNKLWIKVRTDSCFSHSHKRRLFLSTDPTATELPIPGVRGEILEKVLEYMNHHKGTEPPIIPKPLRSKEMKQVCSDPWDATYIDKVGETRQDLYDLILVCHCWLSVSHPSLVTGGELHGH